MRWTVKISTTDDDQTAIEDESESETEAPSRARQRRGRNAHRERAKPPDKLSYEASPEVQHWLRQQEQERIGLKPAFTPSFLAGQREREWVLSALTQFYEEDLIADVLNVVRSGKEATVYCCAGGPAAGMEYAAAKVYRPRMFRGLKNDAIYRESRPIVNAEGHEVRSRRDVRGAMKKTERGKAVEVSSWIHYEYETQRVLWEAGADVPRPLSQIGNSVLMAYIGEPGDAAPKLAGVALEPDEAQELFAQVLRNIELCLAHNRIHGDLSAYNILYWQGAITLIDFAQAVDPRYGGSAYTLLERDMERVCHYFARFGVQAEPRALARELWARYG